MRNDDYLSAERDRTQRKRKINVFYPSDLTFPCLRCQYLRYTTSEIPLSPKTQRIFKIGTLIHEFIQDTFSIENSEFSLISLETSIRHSYRVNGDRIWIVGRADAIIEHEGEEYLVELKSVTPPSLSDDVFSFLLEPREQHLKQILWYMQSANIYKGFLLYFEKFGGEIKTFPISLDQYRPKLSIIDTAKTLYQHIKAGTIPLREPYHWNNQICDYCQYAEVCERKDLVEDEHRN